MEHAYWDELRVSLVKEIERWSHKEAGRPPAVQVVGYWSDAVVDHMATAAITVLKASAEKETWLVKEGYLKL